MTDIAPVLPSKAAHPRAGSFRVTFGGVLFVVVALLLGLAGLNGEINLLLLLFGICVGALPLGAVLSTVSLRRLVVERIVPDGVVAGQPFVITYAVHNRRRRGRCWSVVVTEVGCTGGPLKTTGSYAPVIAAGETRHVGAECLCARRGLVTLDSIRVATRFPFGLFVRCVTLHAPARIVVYPPPGRLRRDPWADRQDGAHGGSRRQHRAAMTEEFYGLREYRPGDNLRRIHWRRSARAGALMVREMAGLERSCVIIIVDAHCRPGDPRAMRARELAISFAATHACDALEHGYRVGLICNGATPVVLPPATGLPHRRKLLCELALLQPGPDDGLETIVSRNRWTVLWQGRVLICAATRDAGTDRAARFLSNQTDSVAFVAGDGDRLGGLFEPAAIQWAEPPVETSSRRSVLGRIRGSLWRTTSEGAR